MQKIAFLTLLLLLVVPAGVYGHATTMSVKVIDVSPSAEGYQLKLASQGEMPSNKQLTIHLRFNPERAAFAASHKREDFDKALRTLQNAASKSESILIGLMSGKGFNAINGRSGHYRSEMIQLVGWFQQQDVVCFFHSDHYVVAPK
jgi:hypothetical protein